MGYEEESIPEEVKKDLTIKSKSKKAKKVVEKVEETAVEKLEKDLEELKMQEQLDEEIQENKIEEKPSPTVNDVLSNHEQRLMQMEAKWFRLGGI